MPDALKLPFAGEDIGQLALVLHDHRARSELVSCKIEVSIDRQPLDLATNANIAAMVANPADLVTPRPEAPFDAGRRQVVIDKYRAGQATASVRDAQADGAISRVMLR